jgi:ComF family protein
MKKNWYSVLASLGPFMKNYSKYWVLELLAPCQCAYCKKYMAIRDSLCNDCVGLMRSPVSILIQLNQAYTMPVYALSAYEGPIKSLILAKHYGNRTASRQLGQLIADHVYKACDYFIPIPLHWRRYARRGFNQAKIIADVLARARGKTVVLALKRNRHTPFQFLMVANKRSRNVEHAFTVTPDAAICTDKDIVLVDDLMTTGATLTAAGKALLPLKPRSISAIVAARVI